MATLPTVPIGNPAGINQGNPAIKSAPTLGTSVPSGAPAMPGGSPITSTNPYNFGGSLPGGSTSGTVPTTSQAPSTTSGAAPGAPAGNIPGPPNMASSDQQNANLLKQLVDIYGKGEGQLMYNQIMGGQGTESQIFQQWQQSQAPVQAQETANLTQTLGAAGVGANSTVEAGALSNLQAQFNAQAAGVNAQLMQQNQQDVLGLTTSIQQPAISEVASSGWDVFGQVAEAVGSVAGDVLGLGGVGSLFKKAAPTTPGAIPSSGGGYGGDTYGTQAYEG